MRDEEGERVVSDVCRTDAVTCRGARIRTLSALEEGYIDAGLDESQARGKAKETLDRMTKRGIDRSGP